MKYKIKYCCLVCFCLLWLNIIGQTPQNWHLLDKKKDGYSGISLEKAYEFLKGKKSKTIVVAVIDGGVDTNHIDLKNNLWKNVKEIPGNNQDDDGNGYIDDIYGWNFLGNTAGENLEYDFVEAARVYARLKKQYKICDNPDTIKGANSTDNQLWIKTRKLVIPTIKASSNYVGAIYSRFVQLNDCDSILKKAFKKGIYTSGELALFNPSTEEEVKSKRVIKSLFNDEYGNAEVTSLTLITEIKKKYEQNKLMSDLFSLCTLPDYRSQIVKDDGNNLSDKNYGNNDVSGGTPTHGTHVAGIIGAIRGNGIGMDGITDNIQIMSLRVVPVGDEYDKDVALAIRYAVDNGASIINMSFGKEISTHKDWVDEAIKYAKQENVLIVHAAGNEAINIDDIDRFPTAYFGNDKLNIAENIITVGASGDSTLRGLVGYFSNYGKKLVDVFAPGVRIFSTLPKNNYGDEYGTSMAAPVVTGIAALILSYYPDLNAKELKYIIEHSVDIVKEKVDKPHLQANVEKIDFTELCKSGGIVNAYNAILLAEKVFLRKSASTAQ